jgi:hypothetical protein
MPVEPQDPIDAQSASEGTADSFLREVAGPAEREAAGRHPPPLLSAGEVVCDRFVIERLAGSGGMGAVYRSLDRLTGAPVALKMMSYPGRHDDRFAQEARVLATLQHPAIVRYVAHGSTTRGQAYLAMQWLDGEDLATRLSRVGLTVPESLAVVRRLAEGLSLAHARGLVHRDVKPSNVLLAQDDPSRATLLDFGIVHMGLSEMGPTARPRTRTGTVLGTVGYMSPEQAIADRQLDARTDVFALGCVLFECLTGQPAFRGEHVAAVLAKVLRAEAPRVRELRPELPAELDEFVARLVAKERAGRPADGSAVLHELDALGSVAGSVPGASVRPAPRLSGGEQRLVSVLLAAVPGDPARGQEIARRLAGDFARLANGTLLVTWSGRGSPSAQAIAAAVCALELRAAFPLGRITLAAGRANTTAGGPSGPPIDLAASLLARLASPGVCVDEVTAGLLGERFEVGPHAELLGRRSDDEPPRTLLGVPTPCVGRDKELGLLELTLRECIDESVARAVVVTGPAGQGKSRLRHEFLAKARERGDVSILMARADPVGAGSAFMMARQLVRQAIGVSEGDYVAAQQMKLRTHVEQVCQGGDCGRVADFLGELARVPAIDLPSPELLVARDDPQIMAAWLARSFGEWLGAECSRSPLLIVLEDLHWGDVPSVTYLGEGLRALEAKPLMVFALARPELHDTFHGLWTGVDKHEIALGRLPPRAAERLVEAVLKENISRDVVARIVERAAGNAFYLEELIRRVAEGGDDTLPETVLVLVQSRLERLEPEARRIVRAASVFGEVFWRGGVEALLGAPHDSEDVGAWLDALSRGEMISSVRDSRFPAERQYVFRHSLLREGAYAMLTDEDRTVGHRLAGEWLERGGEREPLTMANHFEKGGEPKRAVPWLVRATQVALESGLVEKAMALADRGIACGADGGERGLLRHSQASALFLGGDLKEAVEIEREAMRFLPVGSASWFASLSGLLSLGYFLGDAAILTPALQTILSVPVQPNPSRAYAHARFLGCVSLLLAGHHEPADSMLKGAEASVKGTVDPGLAPVLYARLARAFSDLMKGELGTALAIVTECRALAERTLDTPGRATAMSYAVYALVEAGSYERADAVWRELRAICGPRGLGFLLNSATAHRDSARVYAHRGAEVIASLSGLLDRTDPHFAATARVNLAHALVQTGDLEAGAREATILLEDAPTFPTLQSRALGVLALVELRRQDAERALAFAERGLDLYARAPWPYNGSTLRLARAEALHALGRTGDARIAIREARDVVLHTAATLDGDPELRDSYLNTIHAHARTLQLARKWLSESAP